MIARETGPSIAEGRPHGTDLGAIRGPSHSGCGREPFRLHLGAALVRVDDGPLKEARIPAKDGLGEDALHPLPDDALEQTDSASSWVPDPGHEGRPWVGNGAAAFRAY